MLYPILIIILIAFIYLAAVIFPKTQDQRGKFLGTAIHGLLDEYLLAHTDHDLEKKQLRLHKLTVSADRVLSQVLAHFGTRDSSVKQQLRSALERNIVTYDQFRTLKQFHHMRNEVVHEGLQVYGENEQVIYGALIVLKNLINH